MYIRTCSYYSVHILSTSSSSSSSSSSSASSSSEVRSLNSVGQPVKHTHTHTHSHTHTHTHIHTHLPVYTVPTMCSGPEPAEKENVHPPCHLHVESHYTIHVLCQNCKVSISFTSPGRSLDHLKALALAQACFGCRAILQSHIQTLKISDKAP